MTRGTGDEQERFFALGGKIVRQVVDLLKLWQMKSVLNHRAEGESAEARRLGMLIRTKMFTLFIVREMARQGLLPEAGQVTVRIRRSSLSRRSCRSEAPGLSVGVIFPPSFRPFTLPDPCEKSPA